MLLPSSSSVLVYVSERTLGDLKVISDPFHKVAYSQWLGDLTWQGASGCGNM